MPLLRASDLSLAYADAPVLQDISLTLAAGEIVGLIGPNGAGKSTLIRALLGQLKLAKGAVEWDGKDVRDIAPKALAKRVGYLAQAPTLDPEQTVADVLRIGRAPYWGAFGIESQNDVDVVARVAERLALSALLNRRMEELSGGQRQRVFVGRCLAQQPAALLLDEPNTYLDLRYAVELGKIVRELAAVENIGVIMASHDLNLAAMFADRLILLGDGRVVADGPPGAVLDAARIASVYGVAMARVDLGHGPPVIVPLVR